jgi:Mobilization protein NikA
MPIPYAILLLAAVFAAIRHCRLIFEREPEFMFDRSHYRTKSIGVRVTEADFARLQAMADSEGKSLGEWSRDVLLERVQAHAPTRAEQTMVSEVLALRTILLNVLFSVANGKDISEPDMARLIERADAEKLKKAMQRLGELCPGDQRVSDE